MRFRCLFVMVPALAMAGGNFSAPLAGQEAAPASPQPSAADDLALRQSQIADKFARLSDRLRKLAERDKTTNPERAALLEKVVARAKEKELQRALEHISRGLGKDNPEGEITFADSIENQQTALKEMKSLLELLMNEDRSNRIKDEQARVREYIKEVERRLREQSGVQGRTEGGDDTKRLAGEQGQIAKKTAELAQRIRENEEGNKPGEGKSGEGKEGEPAPGKEGKPGEAKEGENNEGKAGEGKEGKSPAGKSGEGKSGEGKEGKPGEGKEGKSGEGKEGKSGESKEGKAGEGKSGEGKEGKNGEAKEGKAGEGKSGEGKSGEGKEGKSGEGKEGKSGEGKPSQGQSQPGKEGEGGEGEGKPEQQPPASQDEGYPARKRIQAAEEKMRKAQQKLEEAQRKEAVEEQEQARQELLKAKAELEEILRQLREEEVERMLAMLEGRFKKMLEMQLKVYESTKRWDKLLLATGGNNAPGGEASNIRSEHAREAVRLGQEERKIVIEADKALALLREEGSSVAFPENVEQMRDDMEHIVRRLEKAQTDRLTQGIEEDVIQALGEMIDALQKAQRDQEERRKQQQQQQQQQGEPQDQPLVEAIAELKLIKAMQIRVNSRTQRYARLLDQPDDFHGQATDEELIGNLRELAERQDRIHGITRDIETGKNK